MNEQPNLFALDTYSALENAVVALGGVKRVGYHLRPEMGPEAAGQWLRDACNPKRREVLKPHEFTEIIRLAQESGVHDLMWHICDESGYDRAKPIDREQRKAELEKQFARAVDQLAELTAELKANGVRLESVGGK